MDVCVGRGQEESVTTHPAAEICMFFHVSVFVLCVIFHEEVKGQWAGFGRMEVCQLR